MPSTIVQLSVFTLTNFYGMDAADSDAVAPEGLQCKRWKVLLAAVFGEPSQKLVVFQVRIIMIQGTEVRITCTI